MTHRQIPMQHGQFSEPAQVTSANFPHRSDALFHIQIGVTYACQCRCAHCGVSHQRNQGQILSLSEIVDLCQQARCDMGAQVVELFGGEPLMRKDISEIVAGCSRHLDVWMSSNGAGFTRETAARLASAGLKRVFFSLDSPDRETHDRNRNKPGCFDAVHQAVHWCNALGIDANFSTCAMSRLLKNREVESLIEHTTRSGARKIRLVLPKMSGRLSNDASVLLDSEEIEQIRRLTAANEVAYVEAEGNFSQNIEKCFCLRGHVYVNPWGVVQPCVYTLLNYGNIREYPLRYLYHRMFHHEVFEDKSILNLCLLQNQAFIARYQSGITADNPLREVPFDEEEPLARIALSTAGPPADADLQRSCPVAPAHPTEFVHRFETQMEPIPPGTRIAVYASDASALQHAFLTAFPAVVVDRSAGAVELVISEGLLHRLNDPMKLWARINTLLKPGGSFFVMDLERPYSPKEARRKMNAIRSRTEPLHFQRLWSCLLAAWRKEEILLQLAAAGFIDIHITRFDDFQLTVRGRKPTTAHQSVE